MVTARILKKRADFLRVKEAGKRVSMQAFSLQYRPEPAEGEGFGVGFTCAKRTFVTAVASNRGRRRLKEAFRQVAATAKGGYHYVVVGKPAVLTVDFAYLVKDMAKAFAAVEAANPVVKA